MILQGEPVLGLEAAAASLITPEDTVLNLASGVYGKGFGYWAARYTNKLLEIDTAYNDTIDPQAVREMLKQHPEISIVCVCHHDTPSGTINPIDEIGKVVADHGAYLIVDAVSSFGGMRTHPEDCHADINITGPNKCLGAPPGLTMAGISDRAWEKMKRNPAAPRASMLSILDWEHAWSRSKPFPFTPSVAEVNGLDVALDLYLAEGPEAVWARHALTAKATRAGLRAMGFDIWAARDEIASPTTTALRIPAALMKRSSGPRRALAMASSSRLAAGRPSASSRVSATWGRLPNQSTRSPLWRRWRERAMTACGVKADAGAAVSAAMADIDQN